MVSISWVLAAISSYVVGLVQTEIEPFRFSLSWHSGVITLTPSIPLLLLTLPFEEKIIM